MPAVIQKQVLGESANTNSNVNVMPSAKRRKLDFGSSPAGARFRSVKGSRGHLGSSQPKSQFEEEVLEKLTQDISGGKANNAEKDQQWRRPPLHDFNTQQENLVFQQIEAEEGTLHGGNATVKLFGVTQVSSSWYGPMIQLITCSRRVNRCSCMLQTSDTTFTSLRLRALQRATAMASEST
jgi:DNA polymerase delta subunit 1